MMDVDALLSADGPFLGRLEPSPEESHAVATMWAALMPEGSRTERANAWPLAVRVRTPNGPIPMGECDLTFADSVCARAAAQQFRLQQTFGHDACIRLVDPAKGYLVHEDVDDVWDVPWEVFFPQGPGTTPMLGVAPVPAMDEGEWTTLEAPAQSNWESWTAEPTWAPEPKWEPSNNSAKAWESKPWKENSWSNSWSKDWSSGDKWKNDSWEKKPWQTEVKDVPEKGQGKGSGKAAGAPAKGAKGDGKAAGKAPSGAAKAAAKPKAAGGKNG